MAAVDRLTRSQRYPTGRRGLSVILVQYDRSRYPGALQRLRAHLELLAKEPWSLVAVDNARSGSWENELAPDVTQIGGDNSAWEFSGFDRGLAWLEESRGLTDYVLLVTDAFRAYGDDYLGWFDQALVDMARGNKAVVGWVDSFGRPCSLGETSYESWLRTSFLLAPVTALQHARPLALPLNREEIFSGDPAAPWLPDSPVGPELRRAIEGWLVEGRAEASGPEEGWHSRFSLDAQSLSFFERKAMAILREHHLSIRLRASGVPCFDLRLVGLRAVTSPLAELDASSDQWLGGLGTFAETSGAPALTSAEQDEGPRISVGGGAWTPQSVAFVRWFVLEVAPLVRQREPAFIIEIADTEAEARGAGSPPPASVDILVATGRARWRDVMSDRALLSVVPRRGAGTGLASDGGREDHSLVLESDWQAPRRRARAALELAHRIVGELRRAKADPSILARLHAGGAGGDETTDDEVMASPQPLEPTTLRSSAEYRRWQRVEAEEATRRATYERSLVKSSEPFLVQAWCYVCRRRTGQHVDFEYFGSVESLTPNWRERLVCQECGLNAKSRAVLHVLAEVVVPAPGARILVCEDRSGLAGVLPVARPGALVVDSFGDLAEADALDQVDRRLSQPVDCLLVLDVFATVDDLAESARVCERLVAPGGAVLFTAPFRTDRERTVESAAEDGVHREFGWDVLETFRAAGFEDVAAQFLWSAEFGYLGGTVVVFTARKGSPDG